MTTGLPDWFKAFAVYPTATSYIFTFTGDGYTEEWKYGHWLPIIWRIESDLGGKGVYTYSFSANGYITWTGGYANWQTYFGNIAYRVSFYNTADKVIAGVTELQVPIVVNNVDKFNAELLIPLDRVADKDYPMRYGYNVDFHISYRVI